MPLDTRQLGTTYEIVCQHRLKMVHLEPTPVSTIVEVVERYFPNEPVSDWSQTLVEDLLTEQADGDCRLLGGLHFTGFTRAPGSRFRSAAILHDTTVIQDDGPPSACRVCAKNEDWSPACEALDIRSVSLV